MKHPLNNYFDKIFIISIERNKERLDIFLKNNPYIEVDIFNGIDGKKLYPNIEHVANFPDFFFKENNLDFKTCSRFNKGQLGCAMSNNLVHKFILNNNYNKTLILEDDALLIPASLPDFEAALKELPENWELFYLGYNPISSWSQNKILIKIQKFKYFIIPVKVEGMTSRTIKHRFFPTSFSKNLNKPGLYTGTHAYALSFDGAKKLIELDSPLEKGFDILLMYANYNKLLKSFSLKKQLFIPNKLFKTSLLN